MRKAAVLVAGGLGALGAALLFRRRRPRLSVDPARELGRKLREAAEREQREEQAPLDSDRPLPEPARPPRSERATSDDELSQLERDREVTKPLDLDAFRREVHDRARATVDEMKGPSADC